MRQAALQDDRFKSGVAGRFVSRARVASFPMLDHFRGTPKAAYAAYCGNVLSIPFASKFEILVRIQALGIDREFCHDEAPMTQKRESWHEFYIVS